MSFCPRPVSILSSRIERGDNEPIVAMTLKETTYTTAVQARRDASSAFVIAAARRGHPSRALLWLARVSTGRVLLHVFAMVGDDQFRFHVAGILRELPSFGSIATRVARARTRLLGALVAYLTQPISPSVLESGADPQSLA